MTNSCYFMMLQATGWKRLLFRIILAPSCAVQGRMLSAIISRMGKPPVTHKKWKLMQLAATFVNVAATALQTEVARIIECASLRWKDTYQDGLWHIAMKCYLVPQVDALMHPVSYKTLSATFVAMAVAVSGDLATI
jgi:hypothetical protein